MKTGFSAFVFILFLFSALILPADITIEGSLTHEYSAEPGETIDGSISIQNSGSEPEEVKLFLTDYSSSADGSHYYLDPNTTPRSNASWITLSPQRVTIPAGETYSARYSLTTPNDKTLGGTYWSMLMIEPIPKDSPESSGYDPEQATVGITTVLRYGIRMITHFGGAEPAQPEIEKATVIREEDKRFLHVDITNSGNKLLRINLWAELYTQDGEYIGNYPGEKLAVFPGSSIRFKVDLSSVANNRYLTLVVMDCGNNDVFGVQYTLDLE